MVATIKVPTLVVTQIVRAFL